MRQGFWMQSKIILHDIEIEVPAGTVLGLVGPNGAGKTTTIKMGAGLLEPASGRVLVNGHPASDLRSRSKLGFLTETQYIYPHLRLKEWLVMLAGFSGLSRRDAMDRSEKILEMVELSDRKNQAMRTLSKGQLQRSGLAQAMIHEPEILLLDEPMSGLDPYWRYRVQKILGDFKVGGGTVLFSSHILYDVERFSDQVALIDGGRVRWSGSLNGLARKIKGYEIICRSSNPDILQKFTSEEELVRQSENDWRFSIGTEQKEDILRLASDGEFEILALRPIQEEIEELLFGFNKQTQPNGMEN